jgi:hypothetical protein
VEQVAEEVGWVLETSDSDRYRGQALAVRVELGIHLPQEDPGEAVLLEALRLFERNEIEDEAVRVRLLQAQRNQRLAKVESAMKEVEWVAQSAARLQLPELVVEAELLRAELLAAEEPSRAAERAQRTVDLARQFGFRESLWRGEVLLANLQDGDAREGRLLHYQVCLDLFREMTEGLPPELVSSFLSLPRQRRVLEDLRVLSRS